MSVRHHAAMLLKAGAGEQRGCARPRQLQAAGSQWLNSGWNRHGGFIWLDLGCVLRLRRSKGAGHRALGL